MPGSSLGRRDVHPEGLTAQGEHELSARCTFWPGVRVCARVVSFAFGFFVNRDVICICAAPFNCKFAP